MEDGSFLAVDYGVPVHYEAEEEWEEIDNTLIPQAPSVGLALEGAWRPVVQYRAENGEESRSFAGSLAGGYVFAAETGEVGVRLSLWEEAGEPEAAETEAEETMGTEASTAPVSDEPEETVQETEPLEEPEEPTESPAAEAAIPSEETALEATAESEAEPETVPELNALGEIPSSEEPETVEETVPETPTEPVEEPETEPEEEVFRSGKPGGNRPETTAEPTEAEELERAPEEEGRNLILPTTGIRWPKSAIRTERPAGSKGCRQKGAPKQASLQTWASRLHRPGCGHRCGMRKCTPGWTWSMSCTATM